MHNPIPETYNIEAMKEEAEAILKATTKAVKKMKPNRSFNKGDAIELRRMMLAPGPVCLVTEDNKTTFSEERVNIVYGTEPPAFAMIAYRNAPPDKVITIYTMTRCSERPPYVLPQGSGWFYALSRYGNYKDSYACGNEYIVNIDEHGVVTPAKFISESVSYLGKDKHRVPSQHVLDYAKVYLSTESYILDAPENEIPNLSEIVALVFNIYSNTAYGWEIQFSEQGRRKGQVRFSFQLDVAKKLFRDRENRKPTPTGRLSPIAHFVKAHYREQKPRTLWQKFEYFVLRKRNFSTVKTHLRGATEFYMGDLAVRIKEADLDKDANPRIFFGGAVEKLKEVQVLEDLTIPAYSGRVKDSYVYYVHTEAA